MRNRLIVALFSPAPTGSRIIKVFRILGGNYLLLKSQATLYNFECLTNVGVELGNKVADNPNDITSGNSWQRKERVAIII